MNANAKTENQIVSIVVTARSSTIRNKYRLPNYKRHLHGKCDTRSKPESTTITELQVSVYGQEHEEYGRVKHVNNTKPYPSVTLNNHDSGVTV